MWTQEQIDAMAELNGRHMTDRVKLGARQQNERQTLFESQIAEAKETATRLGIPIEDNTPELPMPQTLQSVVMPPEGTPPGMTQTLQSVVMPPEGTPPGMPVPLPGLPPVATLGRPPTPMPRPLNLRK